MLDGARGADYTIWVVALFLYIIDAARFLVPRHVMLAEAGPGRLRPIFSEDPFTLAGRSLTFTPLLRPDRGAFAAPWGTAWVEAARLTSTTEFIGQLAARLFAVRVFAATAFILLFGVGPGLTFMLGPDVAVLYTAAILYPVVVAAVATVWWQRRGLQLALGRCAWLTLEILVCPAFLPNLVRKITWPHVLPVDAAQILVGTGSSVDEDFLARLERRAQDLVEEAGLEEEVARQELQAYLATVRGAR